MRIFCKHPNGEQRRDLHLSALTLFVFFIRLAINVYSSLSSYQVAVTAELFDRCSDLETSVKNQRSVSCNKSWLLSCNR